MVDGVDARVTSAAPRLALLITARSRSSRLPDKMLADIAGRPALSYPLERMLEPRRPDVRVVCTTTAPEDDRIVALASEWGWLSFRGNEEDVLARYLAAARVHDADVLVNVDGDDLLCGTEYVDRVARAVEAGADFVQCAGLPFGAAPTAIRTAALADVCSWKRERSTQGWAKYFVDPGRSIVMKVEADDAVRRPEYRMTLDYPEDLEFFRALIPLTRQERGGLALADVVAVLDGHPEIAALAQRMSTAYWERFHREHGSFIPPA